ncbi:MAG: DNA polymerase III subunit chi [Gammaproteobacteria bacterium]
MAATFYHATEQAFPLAELEHYCCRVVAAAYMEAAKVLVFCADATQMQRLDAALWDFSPYSFIAHECLPETIQASVPAPANTPVLLSCAAQLPYDSEQRDALVVAPGASLPDFAARFTHAHYVVNTDGGEQHQRARQDLSRLKHLGFSVSNKKIAARSKAAPRSG